MESVGAVASLFTLTQTSLSIVKTLRDFERAIREAPKAIHRLANKITLIQSLIAQLLAVSPELDAPDLIITSELRSTIALALDECSEACQGLQNAGRSPRRSSDVSKRGRLRWALLDKSTARHALEQLQCAESTITVVLQVLQLRSSLVLQTSLNAVLDAQRSYVGHDASTVLVSSKNSNPELGNIQAIRESTTEEFPNPGSAILDTPPPLDHLGQSADFTKPSYGSITNLEQFPRLHQFGISGTLSSTWDSMQTTYTFSLRSRLPRILGCRALVIEFKIRQYVMARLNWSLLHGLVAISNIIAADSEIGLACRQGNEAAAREIFRDRRASPNDRLYCRKRDGTSGDETLLLTAIKSRDRGLVKYLLDVGAHPNGLSGDDQKSPLQEAFKHRDVDICRLLLAKGAILEHLDRYGRNVAHFLFEDSSSLVTSRDSHGLYLQRIHLCLVLLLSHSFDGFGTWITASQSSPFLYAVSKCTDEDVKLLIRYGGHCCLDSSRVQRSPIWFAAAGSNVSALPLLIDAGVDLNGHYKFGDTALHGAAEFGNTDAISWLLKHGAQVNATNDWGETPLHYAMSRGRTKAIFALLEQGVDVSARDHDGRSPLHKARSIAVPKVIRAPLRRGADSNARVVNRRTPLHYSDKCWLDYPPIDELESLAVLYAHGADPHLLFKDTREPPPVMLTSIQHIMMTNSWLYFQTFCRYPQLRTWVQYMKILHKTPHRLMPYFQALRKSYPEVSIDREGDVFWNAQEACEGGYGCSWVCTGSDDWGVYHCNWNWDYDISESVNAGKDTSQEVVEDR